MKKRRDFSMIPSGDKIIDNMRAEAKRYPSTADNYSHRVCLLKVWLHALQQQGMSTETIVPHVELTVTSYRPIRTMEEKCRRLDMAIELTEKIQHELAEGKALKAFSAESDSPGDEVEKSDEEWPMFQRDIKHSGFSQTPGPRVGACNWRVEAGIAWEAAPLILGDSVFVTTPSARSVLIELDAKTGEELCRVEPEGGLRDFGVYTHSAAASTPFVYGNNILYRELGSLGNKGDAKHVGFVDLETKKVTKRLEVGHVDYRCLYATMAVKGDYIIFPHAVQDIHTRPPLHHPFDRLRCVSASSGELLFDFFIGHTSSEPVIEGEFVYIGTNDGNVYCIRYDNEPAAFSGRLQWIYKSGDGVNSRVSVQNNRVYFGSNDGCIYCLDAITGELIYQKKLCENEGGRSRRLFSEINVYGEKLYFGSSDKNFYIMGCENGEILLKYKCAHWIRSTPAVNDNFIYVASVTGELYCFENSPTYKLKFVLSDIKRGVFSALKLYKNSVVYTDSALYVRGVDCDGKRMFDRPLLITERVGGRDIRFDQLMGGAYYQSKLTAANGCIFVGNAMRMLLCLDYKTGEELWRCEISGPISCAPAYSEGKVYLGQQGGDDKFYCVDAADGSMVWTQSTGWVWGSAMPHRGKLLLPGIDGYAYCLEAKSGKMLWRYRTSASTCTEALVDDEAAYFGGWDHVFYKIDLESGRLIWKHFLNMSTDSGSATMYENRIVVPVGGKVMRCLDSESGEELWRHEGDRITNFNVSACNNGEIALVATQYADVMFSGVTLNPHTMAFDLQSGEKLWEIPGGSLPGAVCDREYAFISSASSPFITAVSLKEFEDGLPKVMWRFLHGSRVEESCPALYRGRFYIYTDEGCIYCIK